MTKSDEKSLANVQQYNLLTPHSQQNLMSGKANGFPHSWQNFATFAEFRDAEEDGAVVGVLNDDSLQDLLLLLMGWPFIAELPSQDDLVESPDVLLGRVM